MTALAIELPGLELTCPEPTVTLGPLPCGACHQTVVWLRTFLGTLILVEPSDEPLAAGLSPWQAHECLGGDA